MINAIGAMHASLRAKKKQPEDNINFRIETKRIRRKSHDDEDDEDRPRRQRDQRGVRA